MSQGIAAANLGLTVQALSDLAIIDSNLSDVQSDLISAMSDIEMIQSDLSDVQSDIIIIQSDVKAQATAIDSDIVVLKSDIAALPTTAQVKVSYLSCTTTGVIVEDGATGTPNVVSVGLPGGVDTFTAWTLVDASVAADSWICSVSLFAGVGNDAADTYRSLVFEIGKGGEGAEVSIIRHSVQQEQAYNTDAGYVVGQNFIFDLPIPIYVAAGTRLTFRVSSSDATGHNMRVSVQRYQTLET